MQGTKKYKDDISSKAMTSTFHENQWIVPRVTIRPHVHIWT